MGARRRGHGRAGDHRALTGPVHGGGCRNRRDGDERDGHGRPPVSEAGTFAPSGQVAAELVVTGMTCGSCAARIERRLNRLDGVAATVNYATGRAYFTSTGGREAAELIGVVNSTGYQAAPAAPPQDDGQPADPHA